MSALAKLLRWMAADEVDDALERINRKFDAESDRLFQEFTCPVCGRTSHNQHDVAQRYCGACHKFDDKGATR